MWYRRLDHTPVVLYLTATSAQMQELSLAARKAIFSWLKVYNSKCLNYTHLYIHINLIALDTVQLRVYGDGATLRVNFKGLRDFRVNGVNTKSCKAGWTKTAYFRSIVVSTPKALILLTEI